MKATKAPDMFDYKLRALRITMLLNFLRLRKFLSGQSCKLFCAGLARSQQSRDHFASFFRHNIAMGLRDFGNEAVSPQQSQPSSHGCHLPALFCFVISAAVQMRAHVAVAKTVE